MSKVFGFELVRGVGVYVVDVVFVVLEVGEDIIFELLAVVVVLLYVFIDNGVF